MLGWMGVVQRVNVADECVTPCGDVLSLAWRLFYGCAWISHTTNGSVAGHGVVKKEQDSYLETQIIMEEFKKRSIYQFCPLTFLFLLL